MISSAATPQEYVDGLPEDRKRAVNDLRSAILQNIPKGFTEAMVYGMLGYAASHSLYPSGYHCDQSSLCHLWA
jgi:hypothetical protein